LQRQLAEFVAQSVEYVIIEVSSHALEQQRVADIHFISAVFTNLTQDHLDFHKTMEAYAASKAQLFAWPNLKTVILNKDDPQHLTMVTGVALHTKIYYYSIAERDDSLTYADDLTLDAQGLGFHLHSFAGEALVKTQLLGSFNVSNLLAAFTTLLSLNFSLSALAKLSILVHPVKGRMEVLRYPNLPLTVIDYAHTPDGLEKALSTLKAYAKPVWVVFGCGGNRDAIKRPIMASIAENLADQVIITEDNSRKESPEIIFADIFKGFKKSEAIRLIPKRAEAITYALTHAPKDAIILLAGKGHETYLETQGQKLHFDERDVVKKLAHVLQAQKP
jgi:UDP-N-acetylmuramoyl-L-alanyl-D-glutamate--2,6-diaminopimelate ligase